MNNNDLYNIIFHTIILSLMIYAVWQEWDNLTYLFKDPSTNQTNVVGPVDESTKIKIYINHWINCSTDSDGAIYRLPDLHTMKLFLYSAHEKRIPLTANDSLIIMKYFINHKIPFDQDLFFLIAHQFTSVNGKANFHAFADNYGFKNYIAWLTQIYKDVNINKLSPDFAHTLEVKDFSKYNYSFTTDFHLMFQDYHNDVLIKHLKNFNIHGNPIQKAINNGIPTLDIKKSCFTDPSHTCESCSVNISFGPNEHWAFDILSNKFDHLYTLIRDEQGNLIFKYSSYSDMYEKRLNFIEQIRSIKSDVGKNDFLEVKCSKFLNNAFDAYLGFDAKNVYMIRETNYWNMPYDTDYFIKILKNNPNHHLMRQNLSNIDKIKFHSDADFYHVPIKTLHDWIYFGEYYKANIAITHRCHLWDSFIRPNNDALANQIKLSLIKDDPVELKIWDMLVNEDDEKVKIALWSFLLRDEQNLMDFVLEYEDEYWRIKSKALYPIREKDPNSTDEDSYDNRVFIIDDDGPGPGPRISWEPSLYPNYELDTEFNPISDMDIESIISNFRSFIEGTVYSISITIIIIYTFFVWFMLFRSILPILKLQYTFYKYKVYYFIFHGVIIDV